MKDAEGWNVPRGPNKLNVRSLLMTIDLILDGHSYRDAADQVGAGERTIFDWKRKSIDAEKAGDQASLFYLEHGGVADYWHNHVAKNSTARRFAVENHWKVNPRYRDRDDDFIRMAEGLDDDADVSEYRFERDEFGDRIPLRPEPLPFERPEPPKVGSYRKLASMSPEARRAALGASRAPNAIPDLGAGPGRNDRPDDAPEIAKPVVPPGPPPGYAKPVRAPSLDRGEGIGPGTPPPGGMKMA